jgi:hypothetical protein
MVSLLVSLKRTEIRNSVEPIRFSNFDGSLSAVMREVLAAFTPVSGEVTVVALKKQRWLSYTNPQ